MNDFIVIIPSRLSSTRLKEKALLDLNGKSLIERVYLRAIHECAKKLNISDDMVIVNVQGDEPFIDPETINKTADIIFNNKNASVGSACTLFKDNDFNDPNNVKVYLSDSNRALFESDK